MRQVIGCSTRICYYIKPLALVLVLNNQTFPPFGVSVKIVSLTDLIIDYIAHGLRYYKIWLFVIIHHQNMPKQRQPMVRDPFLLI
jgi:hypothetical protein